MDLESTNSPLWAYDLMRHIRRKGMNKEKWGNSPSVDTLCVQRDFSWLNLQAPPTPAPFKKGGRTSEEKFKEKKQK